MDLDQDLLDQLEKREGGGMKVVFALVAAISAIAGFIGYFTLQLQLHPGRQISLDIALLIALSTGVLLLVGYRRFAPDFTDGR